MNVLISNVAVNAQIMRFIDNQQSFAQLAIEFRFWPILLNVGLEFGQISHSQVKSKNETNVTYARQNIPLSHMRSCTEHSIIDVQHRAHISEDKQITPVKLEFK